MLNFIKNISPTEILIIALIFIVFFGSKIVTNLGKSGGETLKAIKHIKKNFSDAINDDEEKSDSK